MFVPGRVALALGCGLSLLNAQGALPTNSESPVQIQSLAPSDPIDAKTDANIAEITADVLQKSDYAQHPFDQEIAGRFLDHYLDTLDYSHMYFLKSDVEEFEKYRTNLNTLTLENHDISPCWVIFARFMQRANERVSFVTNLLAAETFDFSGQERFIANRHALPYPQDMAQAREFWRQEVRCEYLDHLLSAPDIQFSGPLSRDTNSHGPVLVSLTRDKMHPMGFGFLPASFVDKEGHAFGFLTVTADSSNATLRLDLPSEANLRKLTNVFVSKTGEKLGEVSFHREKIETNDAAPALKAAAEPNPGATNFEAVIRLNQKNLSEISKTLIKNYSQLLRNYKELDSDRVFEIYLNSLARAYDPHSDYMGHMQTENFGIQMKLSLFGIGALLGSEDGYCKILELKEGPAQTSGQVHVGDRIVKVAQENAEAVDVVGMPLDKVVEKIRGAKGTKVVLTIIPAGAADSTVQRPVTLTRDEIKLEDSAAKARLYERPREDGPPLRVGVIDLPSFYANNDETISTNRFGRPVFKTATSDVARLVARLKKENVAGIVLDLRRNGGGYLDEAVQLTGLFIQQGPVVQTKSPEGESFTFSAYSPPVQYDGPLVVLTSRLSASASEILAGALQDYDRALIIGDRSTFGKGTVQEPRLLKRYFEMAHLTPSFDPGMIKVTTKKFYRASGASTQLKGVASDIQLPSVWDFASDEIVESASSNALRYDEVAGADRLKNFNLVKPYLAELRQLSAERLATNKDFAYIHQDIDEYLKQRADKSISLSMTQRLAEQKERTDRAETRKKERLSRKRSDEKVYEITSKNVDAPGLHPLEVKTNSVAAPKAPDFDDDSDFPGSDSPSDEALDPTLDETRNILRDYVALITKEPAISKALAPHIFMPPDPPSSRTTVR